MYVSAISTRFSRGMSMPAMRAISLPLPLLVLGIGADDHHGPVATNDFAVVATRLDGGSDFQRFLVFDRTGPLAVFAGAGWGLLEAVGNATAGEVIRRELHPNAVARQDADEVHSQFAADVCQYPVAVLEFDCEHCVGQRLD